MLEHLYFPHDIATFGVQIDWLFEVIFWIVVVVWIAVMVAMVALMITAMIIGVPSAIKTFNWLGMLYKGDIHYTAAMMNALAFVSMFVIGGLSGIWMACTPVDMYIHDTYFIVAQFLFLANLIWSCYKGAKAAENPWRANTLEWTTPSPPPHGNWPGRVPIVYRGAYEYSSSEVAEDFLPQSQLLEHSQAAAD